MRTPVKRAFKYRFHPTPDQAVELSRTFGCVRTVYNLALQARAEAWTLRQERITYNTTSSMLTAWKKSEGLAYLSEVSSVPLQQALRHLNAAFMNFFTRRSKHPRFKSKKRSRASAEYTRSAFRFRDGQLTLAKMREPLAIVWSRPLPHVVSPTTVTVSGVRPLPTADAAVGIDLGLDHLLTLSSNRNKARRSVARVHARIADRRQDYLHKLSTRLVRENQTLVIEDLTVRNMVKNRSLARAISDAAWREFRRMLEYKAAWYGRELVVVDRWFPSSKLCSACGALRDRMPLHVRSWTCACGSVNDRDVNAARNRLAAGLAVSACGADVRPQRESSRTGRSAVNQESPQREPWVSPRS